MKKIEIDKYNKPTEEKIKKKLTKEQYNVTQENYTENKETYMKIL